MHRAAVHPLLLNWSDKTCLLIGGSNIKHLFLLDTTNSAIRLDTTNSTFKLLDNIFSDPIGYNKFNVQVIGQQINFKILDKDTFNVKFTILQFEQERK